MIFVDRSVQTTVPQSIFRTVNSPDQSYLKSSAWSLKHGSRPQLSIVNSVRPMGTPNFQALDPVIESRIALSRSTGSLDLSGCELSEVPSQVWDIENLELLSLSGNAITELPSQLGKLKQLKRLGLSGNLLRHLPPEVGSLTNLEGLWVHGNLLQSLPMEVGSLRLLSVLALDGNQLHSLPSTIGQLGNLQTLSAAGNMLQDAPEEIGQLKSLKTLALHGNYLTEFLSQGRIQLASLQELWLQGNRLESIPGELASLASLQKLSLADNRLTYIPESVSALQSLETLWLYGNKFAYLPESLEELRSLQHVWLESNPLEGSNLQAAVSHLRQAKTIGVDGVQALSSLSSCLSAPSVLINQIGGTMAAATSGGYFKIQPWFKVNSLTGRPQKARVLVVAYGSAPGVPNWGGTLSKVKERVVQGTEWEPFDVLYVVDSTRSWYSHPPLSTNIGSHPIDSASWIAPSKYYGEELRECVKGYSRVVMVGDSMGASAALLFSPLATSVLAFCPQVDLSSSSIRPGREEEWKREYCDRVMSAVKSAVGCRISVHCGDWLHDAHQANLLAGLDHVNINIHPFDGHRLALALNNTGELCELVLQQLRIELSVAEAFLFGST